MITIIKRVLLQLVVNKHAPFNLELFCIIDQPFSINLLKIIRKIKDYFGYKRPHLVRGRTI